MAASVALTQVAELPLGVRDFRPAAFQDRTGESTSSVAHPSLPAEGSYVDDSLCVTYWQQSMDNALSW
ncbi:hypothetical protein SBI_09723 [Streptomyces bingchenggensis BCW-1]|uniref:Uncharacterized protein n=1 Tax=Streptomyces bingchenggensis (strain BCW-1) TaxID=749414 RepID=D7CBG4_STRBB|nr:MULTISPECIES: hypothetical protein [Streptomyces]ADI12841.1 hypothetical protein SBI_09723 [Streptomyces bingchenggensis BCW-1]